MKITIDGQEFDTDELTYGEQRAARRLIRTEIWDEDLDGPFKWDEVAEFEILPATIAVLLLRDTPGYTAAEAREAIKAAMGRSPMEVLGTADDVPPTNSQDSSDQTDPSVEAGPQT